MNTPEILLLIQNIILIVTGIIILFYTRETKRISDQYRTQNENINIQRFENKFFSLLNVQNDILKAMDYPDYENGKRYILNGHSFTYKVFFEIKNKIKAADLYNNKTELTSDEIRKNEANIKSKYEQLCENYQPFLGHFYRYIYHFYLFLDNATELDDKEKYYYGKLIRAQFTIPELNLLLYNGIGKYGVDFKPLMEKYELLKTLEERDLIVPNHKYFYQHLKKAIDKKKISIG